MIHDIFQRIQKEALKMGWSTHELAKRTGIAQPILFRLFKHLDSIAKLESYIDRCVEVIGCDKDRLLGKYDLLEHLPLELQKFVIDKENEKWIRKAFMEKELDKMNKDLRMNVDLREVNA